MRECDLICIDHLIGMCGYTAVPEDGRTCSISFLGLRALYIMFYVSMWLIVTLCINCAAIQGEIKDTQSLTASFITRSSATASGPRDTLSQ